MGFPANESQRSKQLETIDVWISCYLTPPFLNSPELGYIRYNEYETKKHPAKVKKPINQSPLCQDPRSPMWMIVFGDPQRHSRVLWPIIVSNRLLTCLLIYPRVRGSLLPPLQPVCRQSVLVIIGGLCLLFGHEQQPGHVSS